MLGCVLDKDTVYPIVLLNTHVNVALSQHDRKIVDRMLLKKISTKWTILQVHEHASFINVI